MYLKKRFHLCYQRTVLPARLGRDFISNITQSVWCARTFSLRRLCRRALVAIASRSCESVDLRRPKLALLCRRAFGTVGRAPLLSTATKADWCSLCDLNGPELAGSCCRARVSERGRALSATGRSRGCSVSPFPNACVSFRVSSSPAGLLCSALCCAVLLPPYHSCRLAVLLALLLSLSTLVASPSSFVHQHGPARLRPRSRRLGLYVHRRAKHIARLVHDADLQDPTASLVQANSFDRRQTLGGGGNSLSEVQGLMSLATNVANDIANGNATSACSNWVTALQVCLPTTVSATAKLPQADP